MKELLRKGTDLFTQSNYPYYKKTSIDGKKISNKDLNFLMGEYIPFVFSKLHPNMGVMFIPDDKLKKLMAGIKDMKTRLSTNEALQVELIKNIESLLFSYDLYQSENGVDATSEVTNEKDYRKNREGVIKELEDINFAQGTVGYAFKKLLDSGASNNEIKDAIEKVLSENNSHTMKTHMENAASEIMTAFRTNMDDINLN